MSRLEKILSLALLVAVSLLTVQSVPTIRAWLPTLVAPAAKVTAATYFFEKDKGAATPQVKAAISKLNEQGIVATIQEVDTTNPSGQVPKQYAISQPAALKAGIPCLVVMAGDKVHRTVPNPTTESHVLEAVK